MSDWISVDDWLPPRDVEVLTINGSDGHEEYNIAWRGRPSGWYYNWDGSGLEGVTHWMPLPNPPKESAR